MMKTKVEHQTKFTKSVKLENLLFFSLSYFQEVRLHMKSKSKIVHRIKNKGKYLIAG